MFKVEAVLLILERHIHEFSWGKVTLLVSEKGVEPSSPCGH